jgi:PilZ domain
VTPLRSRYVTVALAVVGELPAVVEAEDEQGVTLSLSIQPPPGLDRAVERGPVRIECISPRGIQRIVGTASWSNAAPDRLSVRREDDATIQRRDNVRVQATVAAKLSVDDGSKRTADTTTINLSGTGMLLRDPFELEIGVPVSVLLSVEDGGPPLAITGEVVRAMGRDEKGVRIDRVSRPDHVRLTRYITERQRAELRIARGG